MIAYLVPKHILVENGHDAIFYIELVVAGIVIAALLLAIRQWLSKSK